MPKKIACNVEGIRVLDNENVIEDVQSMELPEIAFTTTEVDSSGMVAAIDVPSMTHIDAMEYSIEHNNGLNCNLLSSPGKHFTELRIARQAFNSAKGEMELESIKHRMTGVLKSSKGGSVEQKNPLGTTETYSVLRYEKEVNGEIVILIDVTAGILKVNGKDYTSDIESLLN
ncbi:MAG: phage major tail tube protein [Prevotella sp.]|nr:phage major tail tube protein [Prevotella sp.]